MKTIFLCASAGAMLLLISLPLAAQDGGISIEQMQQCREIADTEDRLACFDNMGEPTPTAETAAETPAETAVETAAEAPAEAPAVSAEVATVAVAATASSDDQSDEEFGLPKSEDSRATIQANVVRCGEASNRKYYFYLDNGQIWQYLGNRKLKYRDCNSPTTITEDSMGYSLQMEGDSSHRVQRFK